MYTIISKQLIVVILRTGTSHDWVYIEKQQK